MLTPQFVLPLAGEIIVDLFAGGGGWSSAFETATGQHPHVAINHDADAISMHEANHPQSKHYQADIYEVCPGQDVWKQRQLASSDRASACQLEYTGTHADGRIGLTDVRVGRLQAISEADCYAEGCAGGHGSIPGYSYHATPSEHFHHIWTSVGGSWDANPWVWIIELKRIINGNQTQ
ncbi:hypothetical protein ACMHYO_16330 [Allopusillimonas ginsengisoli]|uniref:hypothetical protein n=1 Tax=Allopusillimonas ginsengisoli TaxID=453575 RepID=UPI0039C340E9